MTVRYRGGGMYARGHRDASNDGPALTSRCVSRTPCGRSTWRTRRSHTPADKPATIGGGSGLAAAPAGALDHAVPRVAEQVELLGRGAIEEQGADAGELRDASRGKLLATGRRELGELAAGVVGAGDPLDEAPRGRAVDDPRRAAAAEQDRRREQSRVDVEGRALAKTSARSHPSAAWTSIEVSGPRNRSGPST